MLSDQQQQQRLFQLGSVFSPSAPIISKDLFYGRLKQLTSIAEMVGERGQHAVLFGERGVGKTSLANIILKDYQDALTTKVICSRNESFKELWQKAFSQLSFTYNHSRVGFLAETKQEVVQLDLFLPEKETINSTDIQTVLAHVSNSVLILFDEFDSISDSKTRASFADTIKALSDSAPNIKILIVGIGSSISNLIGDHPSIERNIKQVYMPRMSREELEEIIVKGLARLSMTIDPEVKNNLIDFSDGFPHYIHLLAKFSAKAAITSKDSNISRSHFNIAISESVENVQESVRKLYERAILSVKAKTMFESTLFACSIADVDQHGTFRATDLQLPLKEITGKDVSMQGYLYNLGKLCQSDRGAVLEKTSGKKARYRFRNPLFKAFVRIRLYQEKLKNAGELF